MKSKRFFYHFRKSDRRMSVHFDNACTPVNDIVCLVPCETKWNKRQPYLVMRGFAKEVVINGSKAIIR